MTATVRAYGCLVRCDPNRTVSRSNPARVRRRCRHQPRPDPGCTPRFSAAPPENVLARDNDIVVPAAPCPWDCDANDGIVGNTDFLGNRG